MKKLITGLMGLMLLGAMALPVAAQGRGWNRDNQNNSRRDNNRRGNEGYARRDPHQRYNSFNWRQNQRDEFDTYGQSGRWQQRHREDFRFNGRRFHQHNRGQRY